MSHAITEADWTVFRQIHAVALQCFCQRVIAEIVCALPPTLPQMPRRTLLGHVQTAAKTGRSVGRGL